jgi:hypothetical protein
MSESLESALTRTLSEAAGAAPEPPIDLLPRVDTGFRQRRRRRHSVVAGLAAFAVMLGSTVWAADTFAPQRLDRAPLPPVKVGPSIALPTVKPAKLPKVAAVWPDAYHTISRVLPDGRKLRPELLINEYEVLATTEAGFEQVDELWVINLRSDTAHLAARIPEPAPGKTLFASHFTVGSDHVVWWDGYAKAGKDYTRIWKMRLPGSDPVLVATVPGIYGSFSPTGDQLAVHRGVVYFSDGRSGGVYRVPLTGGESRLVPDTKGYQIVSWPWVGKPNGTSCEPGLDGESPCVEGGGISPAKSEIFTELWNVETGDRRGVAVPRPGLQGFRCVITYCLATDKVTHEDVVFSRDAGRDLKVPGRTGFDQLPMIDRFVTVSFSKTVHLYDIETGLLADLELKTVGEGPLWGAGYADSRMIAWPVHNNLGWAIVDLAAIR